MQKVAIYPDLSHMPQDILDTLMNFLSVKDAVRLARVCKWLKIAARKDDYWNAKLLYHFGQRPSSTLRPPTGYQLFVQTATKRNVKLNKTLLFLYAKEHNSEHLKKAILARTISIDDLITIFDGQILTPLDWLIKSESQALLDIIFSIAKKRFSGTNITCSDRRGWSIINWAIATNQNQELIWSYYSVLGQEIGATTKISNLYVAAEFNHAHIIRFLHKKSWILDYCSVFTIQGIEVSRTALHIAAVKGHLSAVETLLGLGADPNSVASELRLNLNFAVRNGNIKALHYAAQYNHIEVVNSLLARDCSPFEEDHYGNSPLRYAASFGYNKIFDMMIKQNQGPVNIQSCLNRSLFDAVAAGHEQFIQPLVSKGADARWHNPPNSHLNNSRTAVDIAIQRRDVAALRSLVNATGLQINTHNHTPSINYAEIGLFAGLIGGDAVFMASLMYLPPSIMFTLGTTSIVPAISILIVAAATMILLGGLIGYTIGKLLEVKQQADANDFLYLAGLIPDDQTTFPKQQKPAPAANLNSSVTFFGHKSKSPDHMNVEDDGLYLLRLG